MLVRKKEVFFQEIKAIISAINTSQADKNGAKLLKI